jgi:hypothetical protein
MVEDKRRNLLGEGGGGHPLSVVNPFGHHPPQGKGFSTSAAGDSGLRGRSTDTPLWYLSQGPMERLSLSTSLGAGAVTNCPLSGSGYLVVANFRWVRVAPLEKFGPLVTKTQLPIPVR